MLGGPTGKLEEKLALNVSAVQHEAALGGTFTAYF